MTCDYYRNLLKTATDSKTATDLPYVDNVSTYHFLIIQF